MDNKEKLIELLELSLTASDEAIDEVIKFLQECELNIAV